MHIIDATQVVSWVRNLASLMSHRYHNGVQLLFHGYDTK